MDFMSEELRITATLAIPMREVDISAIRASGSGGQNVNKVSTAVHLRFDIRNSASLDEALRERLLGLGDSRVTSQGVIVIKAQQHRSQERNRAQALDRLAEFIRSGLEKKKRRVPTRPSAKARQDRLDRKHRRADIKKTRGRVVDD